MKAPVSFLCATVLIFAACQSSPQQSGGSAVSSAASLESFADSLVRLDPYATQSIGKAADYFQRLVPADSLLADSAAVLFLQRTGMTLDSVNGKLLRDTADYFALVYDEGRNAPAAQKQFQQSLLAGHIRLQGDGEGGVYAVLDYAWALPLLQQKTSSATDAYLTLLSREETKPTLLDAGLAVEITELMDRAVAAENLLSQKLPHRFQDDVAHKHRFYTSVLLLGSDNSPSLEYNRLALSEEYAKGYAYLLQRYPASKTAQLVKQWQAIIASKDQKKADEWRSRYALE